MSNPVFITNEISTSTQSFDSFLINLANQKKQAKVDSTEKPIAKIASTETKQEVKVASAKAASAKPEVKAASIEVKTVKKAETDKEKEKDLTKAQEKLPDALKKAIEKKEDKKDEKKDKVEDKKEDKKDEKKEEKKDEAKVEEKKDEKKEEKDCMASTTTKSFVRVAKLNSKTRTFLKDYFSTIYPKDYAEAMTAEY